MHKILIIILLVLSILPLCAQNNSAWRDTLQTRQKLLRELVLEQNYEDAQVESGELRAFLKRNFVFMPSATLGLISNIYLRNKDRSSALSMLAEAEQDVQRDKNYDTKAALLAAIVKEHDRWGNEERATICRQMLQTTQDTLAARQLSQKTRHYEQTIDSLRTALNTATATKENTITLDRYKALALVGIGAFVLLALVVAQLNNNNRWRRKLENRELEFELSHTHPNDLPPPSDGQPSVSNAPNKSTEVVNSVNSSVSAYDMSRRDYFSLYEKEPQVALVVEPNRQIALYVRSLLSSNFEVITADTAAEALKVAHESMPDLIVCDAHLNGQEGIDIVRQIKLAERTNHIPVVLLSKHYGNDGRLDALRAGADAWFTRPMQSDEFNITVKHLIDSQKTKHEEFQRVLQLYFTPDRPPIPNRFIADIIAYIEADMANIDLMPDEIARKMQMSNPLFVRKLRALTGKEPGQLIRELRLEKSKFLLEKRAGTPQAISAMVGFPNPGNFAMSFKDYFGENTLLLMG